MRGPAPNTMTALTGSHVRVSRHAGLGRPAGHADTPLDDQQAMLGLHQTKCFMVLLDDAQCNKNTGMLDDALLLDDRAGQPAFQPGPTERDLVRPCGAL